MSGMHALHKIIAERSRPRRSTVTPGEFVEIEPDVFSVILSPEEFHAFLRDDLAKWAKVVKQTGMKQQ